MSLKNTTRTFGSIAKSFHWIIAVFIIFMLVLGYFLEDFPESAQETAFMIHKSIGILIVMLMILRLVWRLCNVQPEYSMSYPKILRLAAHLSHYALYFLAIAMPLSGWIMSTAAGKIPYFFEWFYFPLPGIPQNGDLAGTMFQIHSLLAIALIALLVLHIVAALFHHFILGDTVLKRMLPNRSFKE